MTLRDDVIAAVEGVADQLGDDDKLTVRSSSLTGWLGCPAAAALDGDEPFEEGAAVAGWGASATVLDRIAIGHLDPHRGQPPSDPATGFRTVLQEIERLDWPWPWIDQAGRADKAVTAAAVHRRVAALARMLEPWPPANVTKIGWRPRWTFPGRPLTLQGRVDAVLGKRDGGHTLVVGLSGDHAPTTRWRVAFEALVEALTLNRPPAQVLAVFPDAGRRWPLQVDDGLLAEGVAVAGAAARVALAVRRRDAVGIERRPGSRCRTCAHVAGCDEGEAWLAGPGSRRHGFLPSG